MAVTNLLVSLWHGEHNVGVLSSTSAEFVAELKRWAEKHGYRVEVSPNQKDKKDA
jgi:hypothetical protein